MKFLTDRGVEEGIPLSEKQAKLFDGLVDLLGNIPTVLIYSRDRATVATSIMREYELRERNPPVTEEPEISSYTIPDEFLTTEEKITKVYEELNGKPFIPESESDVTF
jgi:hypothetical protein